MRKYFCQALEWTLDQSPVVETTRAGIVHNALSHLQDAKNKEEFCCGLLRGFGANLTVSKREELVNKLSKCAAGFTSTFPLFLSPITQTALFDSWTGVRDLMGPSVGVHPEAGSNITPIADVSHDWPGLVMTPELEENQRRTMPWVKNGLPLIVVCVTEELKLSLDGIAG